MRNWTQFTADSLELNFQEMIDSMNSTTDKHDSDMRTITMWKYCTSRGVSGTPTVAVNGIILESHPNDPEEWMDMLTEIYKSQYRPQTSTQIVREIARNR